MSSTAVEALPAPSSSQLIEALDSSIEQANWDQLEKDFRPFWRILVSNGVCEDTPEEYSAAFEREKTLFTKVDKGIEELAGEHSGPITVLADVDEAMAEMIQGKYVTYNVMKPGFLLAINAQKAKPWHDRIDVGLLTSHPQNRLEQELEYPTYLKGLNPEKMLFVLSSRDLATDDAEFAQIEELQNDPVAIQDEANMELVLDSVKGIVDPNIIEATALGVIPLNAWFHIKLAILGRLAQDHPERSFLTIDDLPCANVVNIRNNNVRGVWVGPEIHSEIFRNARINAVQEYQVALAA